MAKHNCPSCKCNEEVFVSPLPEIQELDKDVHTEHCCEQHKVCKYGDKKCSVARGKKPASYRCNCDWM